jgi:hypothetical protein
MIKIYNYNYDRNAYDRNTETIKTNINTENT